MIVCMSLHRYKCVHVTALWVYTTNLLTCARLTCALLQVTEDLLTCALLQVTEARLTCALCIKNQLTNQLKNQLTNQLKLFTN
jgi:hypothetical protein